MKTHHPLGAQQGRDVPSPAYAIPLTGGRSICITPTLQGVSLSRGGISFHEHTRPFLHQYVWTHLDTDTTTPFSTVAMTLNILTWQH